MKINGNGQAKVLTKTELERLFTEGFSLNRDRSVCLPSVYPPDVESPKPWLSIPLTSKMGRLFFVTLSRKGS